MVPGSAGIDAGGTAWRWDAAVEMAYLHVRDDPILLRNDDPTEEGLANAGARVTAPLLFYDICKHDVEFF